MNLTLTDIGYMTSTKTVMLFVQSLDMSIHQTMQELLSIRDMYPVTHTYGYRARKGLDMLTLCLLDKLNSKQEKTNQNQYHT